MSHVTAETAGRFTTHFISVAAADVRVAGLIPGSAGVAGVPTPGFSGVPGLFAIGPDTAALMQLATPARLVQPERTLAKAA